MGREPEPPLLTNFGVAYWGHYFGKARRGGAPQAPAIPVIPRKNEDTVCDVKSTDFTLKLWANQWMNNLTGTQQFLERHNKRKGTSDELTIIGLVVGVIVNKE